MRIYGIRRPTLSDLVLRHDPEIEAKYSNLRRDGNSISGEAYASSLGKSGTYLWGKAMSLYGSSGNLIGVIESIRDITEPKLVENLETGDQYIVSLGSSGQPASAQVDISQRTVGRRFWRQLQQ